MRDYIRREWRDLVAFVLLSFALSNGPSAFADDASGLAGFLNYMAFMVGLHLFVQQRIREAKGP